MQARSEGLAHIPSRYFQAASVPEGHTERMIKKRKAMIDKDSSQANFALMGG